LKHVADSSFLRRPRNVSLGVEKHLDTKLNFTAVGSEQTRNAVKQGRFPRPGRAEDYGEPSRKLMLQLQLESRESSSDVDQ